MRHEASIHHDSHPEFGNASDESIFANVCRKIPDDQQIDGGKLRIKSSVQSLIAKIDIKLNLQMNLIIHAKAFQELEASWRGLAYLVSSLNLEKKLKIKVLNCSWYEIAKDAQKANEFDQSNLFQKVYSHEFGMPGGEPFGILIGDFEVTHRPQANNGIDDLTVLQSIAQVASAAFVPVILSASPTLFGVNSFLDIGNVSSLAEIFSQAEYQRWRRFRNTEDARFIGLVLPKMLMRNRYHLDDTCAPFPFEETINKSDYHSSHLWGNLVYAYALVVARSFENFSWLADITGFSTERGVQGGKINNSVFESTVNGTSDHFSKPAVDVVLTSFQDKVLDELGFIGLTYIKHTQYSVFYGSNSIQIPRIYNKLSATENARYSANLKHILCASRFAHYIKVIMRDEIGKYKYANEIERRLNDWLNQYCISSQSSSQLMLIKYPLAEGRVKVVEVPEKPGTFLCTIHLEPHLQLDQINSTIELSAYFGAD